MQSTRFKWCDRLKVHIDTHEKPYVHKAFQKGLTKAKYCKEAFPIGDIIVGDFVIERKAMNDLYRSIIKGNLFEQLRHMKEFKEQNPEAVLILLVEYRTLTKENKRYYNLWNLDQIMLNCIQEFGVMMVRTKSIDDTVRFINEIVQYTNEKNDIVKKVRGYKRRTSLNGEKVFFLMGLPTIGEKRAERILENHKTIMDYFADQKGKDHKIAQILYSEV